MSEIKAVFDQLAGRFKAGKVEEPVVFYFSIDDEKWTVTIEPDSVHVKEGKTDEADCFLKTSKDLFVKMMSGKYTPGMTDFMSGKVKSNDPWKLKLLQEVFG